MNRDYLLTFGILLLCQMHLTTQAQNDSSAYDLGRVKLSKNFTQGITIKASDLEKMPFANLSEAINVWLYGSYSDPTTLVYIIDGNFASDVNALTIYDIEEVTFIQNALIQVNGATGQQQLVLVRTKRSHLKKSGYTISAQGAAVTPDLNTNTAKSFKERGADVNYYHQYHFSTWHNDDKLQYGLSANYQRDVAPSYRYSEFDYPNVPEISEYKINVPANFNLLRFYGWLSTKWGSTSNLTIGMNLAPQKFHQHQSMVQGNVYFDTTDEKTKESLFNVVLRLESNITKEIGNDFNLSYVTSSNKVNYSSYYNDQSPNPSSGIILNEQRANMLNLIIRDHFSFEKTIGNWHLIPSVNFMFRYLKADWATTSSSNSASIPPNIIYNTSSGEGRYFLITPVAHISFKNSFDWQAGIMFNESKNDGTGHYKRYFPFSTLTFDLLKLAKANATNSLKVFASISEAGNVPDLNYNLQNAFGVLYPPSFTLYTSFTNFAYNAAIQPVAFLDKTPWTWTAGIEWSVSHNRINISYNYEKRDFTGMMGYDPYYVFVIRPYEFNSYTHHLGITAKLVDRPNKYWLTGINFTSIKDKGVPPLVSTNNEYVIGDNSLAHPSWTGGWVNRLQFGSFSAGIDILYHINQPTPVYINAKYEKHTLLRLQSLWAGWNFKVRGDKKFVAYVTIRNLFETYDVIIPDTRKFYGLGAKLDL